MDGYFAGKKGDKEKKLVNRKSQSLNISQKKPAKREKYQGSVKRGGLNESNLNLVKKLEGYRKKLSRMRLFAFSNNEIRADMMYSLLLENEVLEQLLVEQDVMLTDERKSALLSLVKDTQKRQRLLAIVFNDDVIKNYVKKILSDEERLEVAAARIESENLTDIEKESDKLDPVNKLFYFALVV